MQKWKCELCTNSSGRAAPPALVDKPVQDQARENRGVGGLLTRPGPFWRVRADTERTSSQLISVELQRTGKAENKKRFAKRTQKNKEQPKLWNPIPENMRDDATRTSEMSAEASCTFWNGRIMNDGIVDSCSSASKSNRIAKMPELAQGLLIADCSYLLSWKRNTANQAAKDCHFRL